MNIFKRILSSLVNMDTNHAHKKGFRAGQTFVNERMSGYMTGRYRNSSIYQNGYANVNLARTYDKAFQKGMAAARVTA